MSLISSVIATYLLTALLLLVLQGWRVEVLFSFSRADMALSLGLGRLVILARSCCHYLAFSSGSLAFCCASWALLEFGFLLITSLFGSEFKALQAFGSRLSAWLVPSSSSLFCSLS